MAWFCKDCSGSKFRVENDQAVCLGCGGKSVIDESCNLVSFSPVNSESDSDTDSDLEKQHSYDKKRKVLRGIALKAKKMKLVKDAEDMDENLIDIDKLKSSSGVFLHNRKHRSKKANNIKTRVHKDLLALNRECGYSVNLNCLAPVPKTGKRGEELSLFLGDSNGVLPKCVCRKVKVYSCSCQTRQLVNVGIQLQKIPHNSENISTNSRLKLLTPSKIRQVAAREFNGQVVISPIANNSLIGQNVDSAEVPEQTASAEQPVQSASSSTTDQTSVPVVETFLHPSAAYKSGRLTGKVQTDGVVSNLTANFSAAPRLSGHKNSSGQAVTQPLPSSSTSLAGGFSRCSKKLPQLPSLKTSKTKSAQGFTPPCLESIPKKGNKHQFHANLVSI